MLDRNDKNVIDEFKITILNEFENKIKRKMNYYKLVELKRQASRADFHTIKYTQIIDQKKKVGVDLQGLLHFSKDVNEK